jgi:hypothetical protein
MRYQRLALALALATAASTSFASDISFSGFGQVVAGTTFSDNDVFPGRTYDGGVDFKDESLFGLQVTADINENVDAVAQILARGDRDFEAELAWAYVNFTFGEGFSSKVGRQRTALYRYSDFLDVGYAYPWVRPPYSVYNVGFSTLDGVSFTHTGFIGEKWFSQVQVQAGGFSGDFKSGAGYLNGELDNLVGAAWDIEYNDWLAFRAAYFQSDITVTGSSLDGLAGALTANGLGNLASQLDYNEDKGVFTNVGFKIDRNNWLVQGEYVTVKLDNSIFSDKDNWYVSGGYRFGAVTPTVTYGEQSGNPKLDILANNLIPGPFAPLVGGAVLSETFDDRYYGVGVRWDIYNNVALKADYTRFESDTNPLFTSRSDADALTVGVSFTF